MVSNDTASMMEAVYEIAVDEFGRKWVEQHCEGEGVSIQLGGGRYRVLVQAPQEGCVLILNPIDCEDPNLPGLGDAMLREHNRWVLGRIQRQDDHLVVAHTIFHSAIEDQFASTVRTIHDLACHTEDFLRAAFAADEDDEETDGDQNGAD